MYLSVFVSIQINTARESKARKHSNWVKLLPAPSPCPLSSKPHGARKHILENSLEHCSVFCLLLLVLTVQFFINITSLLWKLLGCNSCAVCVLFASKWTNSMINKTTCPTAVTKLCMRETMLKSYIITHQQYAVKHYIITRKQYAHTLQQRLCDNSCPSAC